MSVIAELVQRNYLPLTDLPIVANNAADPAGTLITDINGVLKLTVMRQSFDGPILIPTTTMLYRGTPGAWIYTIQALLLPHGLILCALVQIYGVDTPPTLHLTQPMQLTPVF